jgi:2-keto-4-pentenoate hydratase/2-oxohepta-3-ene-1,7-dioic acid hydratase in catechol pathway
MRIIRYADPAGQIHYASQQPDGSALEIDGDLFGRHSVSSRKANVAKLLAPVQPAAILCIGLNYRRHAEEGKSPIPQWPVLFMKSPGAVQNPGEAIVLPTKLKSTQVDYECELAVVIGKSC